MMMLGNFFRNALKSHPHKPSTENEDAKPAKKWKRKDHLRSTNEDPGFAVFLIMYSSEGGRHEFNAAKLAITRVFPNATVYGKPTDGHPPVVTIRHVLSGTTLWAGDQMCLSSSCPDVRTFSQAEITDACRSILE
mmetsp:Transcript_7142/g.19205  ORF Transcript_7142/g.19205 Transcript_7142/m.19205 type:complete len:135 (+) Transcript_7142:4-408(+)